MKQTKQFTQSVNQRRGLLGGGLKGNICHVIFEEIISLENLFLAWKEFKKGKKKKQDVQEFQFNLEDNLFQLHQELKEKTYRHAPYTAFYITDPKLRHIHKACVRDRVLHHAIFRILYPIFDEQFIFDSYSCRINKGSHRAVRRLKVFCRKASGNNSMGVVALKCDVKKFFDSVDHSVLLQFVRKRICNEDALWLIELVIKSFRADKGVGLPIGNVTSQLFANIYLNELDNFAKYTLKAKYYLRYCDDFVLLNKNRTELEWAVNKITHFLGSNLKISLHPNKIIFRKYHQGIDFLGYVVRPYCINLRTKTKRRILRRVNKNNLPSYLGVLKHCNGYKIQKIVSAKLEKYNSI